MDITYLVLLMGASSFLRFCTILLGISFVDWEHVALANLINWSFHIVQIVYVVMMTRVDTAYLLQIIIAADICYVAVTVCFIVYTITFGTTELIGIPRI